MSIKNLLRTRYFRFFLTCTGIYFALFTLGTIAGIFIIKSLQDTLPSLEKLESYHTSLITKVYSADNKLLKEFYIEKRDLVPLERIPQHLLDALTSTEDRKFESHWGVDAPRILIAFYINARRGYRSQGASTITQQLARMLHLTREKNYIRKIKEALTSVRIERTYAKSEILQMYLNEYYFGHGRYGIQAASQFYFSKNVEDLSIAESAGLIGLLQAPARYSPINHPDLYLARRNIILHMMTATGAISEGTADSLQQLPIGLHQSTEAIGQAPYFVEHVRRFLEKEYGYDMLYKKGASIYTTVDTRLQKFAERAVKKQLRWLQEICDDVRPGTYKDFAQIDTLKTKPVQMALVALDPATGHIKALVGGRNFEKSKFNRAIQAQRQPGSTFKPLIYTAAIDNGYTPVDIIMDSPIVIPMPDGTEYRPQNYGHKFMGPTMMRKGLALSTNLIAIKLLQKVGPRQVIKYARKMGIQSPIQPVLSMALGSAGETNLLEMVSAYSVFANRGIRARPMSITEIRNHDGDMIRKFEPYSEVSLREETAYMMAHMMELVMDAGTGAGARRLGFKRPAGGKTGTTNDYVDAWFIGYTPQLAAGIWVGYDDNTPIGHKLTGSRAAMPVWADFMICAHDSMGLEELEFYKPSTIESRKICKDTGKLANDYCPNVIDEDFMPGTAPKTVCATHSATSVRQNTERRTFDTAADSSNEKKIRRRGLQF